MALLKNRISIAAASLAALSMTAAPLAAAELPQVGSASVYDADALNVQHGRRHHDRGGIDTGDVIAGVLVLGAIAAIASEASRDDDRDDRVRYREPEPRTNGWSSGGIDRAVDMCVAQVERGRDRVDSVDNASRDTRGWEVSGSLRSGDTFSCRIDNDGRVRSVNVDDGYAAYEPAGYANPDGQLSDEAYARARAATRYRDPVEPIDSDLGEGPRPAYPGGPLPGEEGYEESWGG